MQNREKEILFLSLEDVLASGGADMALAAQDVDRGFALLLQGRIQQPHKTTLKPAGTNEQGTGLVNFLPSYVNSGEQSIFGLKALGAMPSNVAKGMPRATGLILLFDPETKSPLCVMDAQVISATRTGAVSMVAARKLVREDEEAVGLIGSGVNMRTQLLGLKLALPRLKYARVYSRGESREIFAREMSEKLGMDIVPVDSARAASEGMKTIVTCLANVSSPVLMDRHVAESGVTVFNIGCYESEAVLLNRMDRVIADIWEQGKHRGVQTHAIAVRDGVIPETKIENLGPILIGEKAGRTRSEENIFFCPTGLGFQDALVAMRVYQTAISQGRGTSLRLWNDSKWI